MGAHPLLRDEATTFLSALVAVVAFAPFALFAGCEPRTPSALARALEADASPTETEAEAGVGVGSDDAVTTAASSEPSPMGSAEVHAPDHSGTPLVASNEPRSHDWDGRLAEVVNPCSRPLAVFVDAHRTCKVDADCAVETTGCGLPGACGIGLQKAATAGLQKASKAAYAACTKRSVPLPCATCTMAPSPRCGAGYCRP